MATAKKTGSSVKKKSNESTDLAVPMEELEALAGVGFEDADQDSYVLPYLMVLQKGSPQVDNDSPFYIPDAKIGQFYNTATGELFDEIDLIPCHYQRAFVNWRKREDGGGWLGAYPAGHEIVEEGKRGDGGRLYLDDGSYLADTRYHFVLILRENGDVEPAIFALASTQIKKSRQWMSTMKALKIERQDGTKFAAPMFSHYYRVTTIGESNDKGSWKGVKIELGGQLTSEHREAFLAAKEFAEQVKSGAARVGAPPTDDEHVEGDLGDDGEPEF